MHASRVFHGSVFIGRPAVLYQYVYQQEQACMLVHVRVVTVPGHAQTRSCPQLLGYCCCVLFMCNGVTLLSRLVHGRGSAQVMSAVFSGIVAGDRKGQGSDVISWEAVRADRASHSAADQCANFVAMALLW